MSDGKRASAIVTTRAGKDVRVYGQLTDDGSSVGVWSKSAYYGRYNIDRFEGGVLTAATLRKVLTA